MKKVISFLFLLLLLFVVYIYRTDITRYIVNNYIYRKKIEVLPANEYSREYNFEFVQNTDNFFPNNKQELYNVFYTIINNGYDKFTFYCGKKYKDCSKDVRDITRSDSQVLATINNYVHPYNSYNSISININNLGRINVEIDKLYNDSDIIQINKSINELYPKIIKENMTVEQKIKAVHDYIINTTVYDKTWVNSKNKTSKANTAYGPLFNHVALCGGYTDLMELFLEKMQLKSYKIANDKHIWNFIKIGNEWKHLDLTWDDPVTNTGRNLLQYDYFLLSNQKLMDKKDSEHSYKKDMYIEAN